MGTLRKSHLLGALVALVASPALAADLPVIELPPVVAAPVKPIAKTFSGWYLRADIGVTNQEVDELENEVLFERAESNGDKIDFVVEPDFDSAGVAGVGVGYKFNRWLRADVTGEYRLKSSFHAYDRYDSGGNGTWNGTNDYNARKSEWLVLANAYVDLGSWYGFSPYVGAGIGMSRNTIDGFTDVNVPTGGVAFGEENSEWDLAWALHAGAALHVTDHVALDFSYRFVHLGDAATGETYTYLDGNSLDDHWEFKDITSHDVRLGVRYMFHGAS